MSSEAILRTAAAHSLPDEVVAGVMAFVKGSFPALSNTFFTTGAEIWNYGATTAEQQGILHAAQAQTAAMAHFGHEWKHYIFNVASPTDVDAISQTIERVLETVVQYGPECVDLTSAEPEQVNGEHLAALLRATFVWQDKVPGWRRGLDIATAALQRAGINPQDALIGLI